MALPYTQNELNQVADSGPRNDTLIHTCSMRVERKFFTFDMRENPRGKFVRITEEVNGRRDAIVVPLPGLLEFRDKLIEICQHAQNHLGKP